MDVLSKIRFYSTTEFLPIQCQLQLLLPSAAGGFPNIQRGCVVLVYSLSFISLPLGSDPAHAAPRFTLDEFGVFCSCALQGYPAQPVTNHMPGIGVKPCCHEAQLLPGPVCLLIIDNLFSHGLLPPLPASDSVDLKTASTSVLLSFGWGSSPAVSTHKHPCKAEPGAHSLGLSHCSIWLSHRPA